MRICAFQVAMVADIPGNVATAIRCVERASELGADLAFMPEMMVTGWGSHLHHLFSESHWIETVNVGVSEIQSGVERCGIRALVGSPFSVNGTYQNAVLLFEPEKGVQYAGGRMKIGPGWIKKWGFAPAESKHPITINDIPCGFVICNEAGALDELDGSGIERSRLIFWPSVTVNHYSEEGKLVKNGCVEGAKAIAVRYRCPVIQSNFINEMNDLPPTRRHGAITAAREDGEVIHQATEGVETHALYEVTPGKTETDSPRISLIK